MGETGSEVAPDDAPRGDQGCGCRAGTPSQSPVQSNGALQLSRDLGSTHEHPERHQQRHWCIPAGRGLPFPSLSSPHFVTQDCCTQHPVRAPTDRSPQCHSLPVDVAGTSHPELAGRKQLQSTPGHKAQWWVMSGTTDTLGGHLQH